MRIQAPQDLLLTLGGNASAINANADSSGLFAQLLQTMPTMTAPAAIESVVLPIEAAAIEVPSLAAAAWADTAQIDTELLDPALPVAAADTALPALTVKTVTELPQNANVLNSNVQNANDVTAETATTPVAKPATTAADAVTASKSKPITIPAVTPVLSPVFVAPVRPIANAAKTVEADAAAPTDKPTVAHGTAQVTAEPVQTVATTATPELSAPTTSTAETSTTTASTPDNAQTLANAEKTVTTEPPAPLASTLTVTTPVVIAPQLPVMQSAGNQRMAARVAATQPEKPANTAVLHSSSNHRGPLLPPSGNELPAAATSPFGKAAPALTTAELPIATPALTFDAPAPAKPVLIQLDTATTQSQWSQQAPLASLTPADAARNAGFSDQSLLPPLLTSTFVMGSAAWSEETVQQLHWLSDDDQQSAQLQLHPAELGRIDINIEIKDGQANVQMSAGNAEARELLEKAMPALRELLSQHGMSLAEGQVSQNNGQRAGNPGNFQSSLPFAFDDELPLVELPLQPGFRIGSSTNRIDYYV